jgi:hypothetical protein
VKDGGDGKERGDKRVSRVNGDKVVIIMLLSSFARGRRILD